MSDARQQFAQVGHVPGKPGVGARCVEDVHVETGRTLRHGAGDPPITDQTEGGAVHVVCQVGVETPAIPASMAEIVLRLGRAAGRRQNQQEREVGRRGIEHSGRIADRDAE